MRLVFPVPFWHTDADLEEEASSLGFRLLEKHNHGRFGRLKKFQNHSFRFVR